MRKYIAVVCVSLAAMCGYKLYAIYPQEITNDISDDRTTEITTIGLDDVIEKDEPELYVTTEHLDTQSADSAILDKLLDENEEMNPDLKAFIASGQPEKIMAYFADYRKRRAELIQEKMSTEGTDHQWEAQMTQYFALSEQLIPQVKGIHLNAADCRESICALTVNYGSDIENYKDIEPYMTNIGNVLGLDTWVHHDASDKGGVIYLAKERLTLPEAEAEAI